MVGCENVPLGVGSQGSAPRKSASSREIVSKKESQKTSGQKKNFDIVAALRQSVMKERREKGERGDFSGRCHRGNLGSKRQSRRGAANRRKDWSRQDITVERRSSNGKLEWRSEEGKGGVVYYNKSEFSGNISLLALSSKALD